MCRGFWFSLLFAFGRAERPLVAAVPLQPAAGASVANGVSVRPAGGLEVSAPREHGEVHRHRGEGDETKLANVSAGASFSQIDARLQEGVPCTKGQENSEGKACCRAEDGPRRSMMNGCDGCWCNSEQRIGHEVLSEAERSEAEKSEAHKDAELSQEYRRKVLGEIVQQEEERSREHSGDSLSGSSSVDEDSRGGGLSHALSAPARMLSAISRNARTTVTDTHAGIKDPANPSQSLPDSHSYDQIKDILMRQEEIVDNPHFSGGVKRYKDLGINAQKQEGRYNKALDDYTTNLWRMSHGAKVVTNSEYNVHDALAHELSRLLHGARINFDQDRAAQGYMPN